MGFFSSKKTFTSLAIIDLNTKDYADRVGFLSAFINAPNGGAAIDGYMQFKKMYINKRASRFAIKNNMAARNAGSAISVDSAKLLKYVQDNHDYRASSIVSANISSDIIYEVISIEMEKKYGSEWSTKTGLVTIDSGDPSNPDIYGKLKYNVVKDNVNTYRIEVNLETKDGSKDINEVFFSNDIYSTHLIIYYSIANIDDYFIVLIKEDKIPSDITNIEPVNSMPIVPIKQNGQFYTDKELQKRYLRFKNIKGDDLIDSLDETDDDGEPVVDNAYFIYAIPLQNQYTAVTPGTYDANQASKFSPEILKRAKKIDGDGDSNKYVIDQELVDWWLHKKRKNVWRYERILFETLKYYKEILDIAGWKPESKPSSPFISGSIDAAPAESNVIFRSGDTLFSYFIDAKIETIDGVLTGSKRDGYIEIGYTERRYVFDSNAYDYAKTVYAFCNPEYYDCGSQPEERDYNDLILECQISEDKYERLTLKHTFTFSVSISGHSFWYGINGYKWQSDSSGEIKDGEGAADPRNVRLIIPEELGLHSRYKDTLIIEEYGFCLVAFSIKEVEVSWLSSLLGIFVSFIVGIFTWGAGLAFTDFLVQFAINTTVSFLVNMVMQALDIPFLNLAMSFFGAFGGVFTGSMSFMDALASNFLPLATQVAQTVQQMSLADAQKSKEEQERIEGLEKSQESIDNMLSETDGPVVLPYSPTAEISFIQSSYPEVFIQQSLGASLYNYDIYFSIWNTMESKTQVQLA